MIWKEIELKRKTKGSCLEEKMTVWNLAIDKCLIYTLQIKNDLSKVRRKS